MTDRISGTWGQEDEAQLHAPAPGLHPRRPGLTHPSHRQRVPRGPAPAVATRNGPCHRRRTRRRGRGAAPPFTPTVLRARLPLGANESPGGLRRRCPAWTARSPSRPPAPQVCGAQVTAPGKRENCKIVAAKSTPLKMAIILTFRVSNNPSGRLMRRAPLFLATSSPGHPWPFRGSQGSQWTQVEEARGRDHSSWTTLVHRHPQPQQATPMGALRPRD